MLVGFCRPRTPRLACACGSWQRMTLLWKEVRMNRPVTYDVLSKEWKKVPVVFAQMERGNNGLLVARLSIRHQSLWLDFIPKRESNGPKL
ncbi:hypothetical protein Syun_018154 [Stephania yunnanensis]|uniref:Uncharacterized protein n=1 Tax=Stephania yunnanensis TaxID=152371 RepID=A0AAP0IRQ9_9MAGN